MWKIKSIEFSSKVLYGLVPHAQIYIECNDLEDCESKANCCRSWWRRHGHEMAVNDVFGLSVNKVKNATDVCVTALGL